MFDALQRPFWGLSKFLEIHTFSIFFAKPGLIADPLLILALPCLHSLGLFTMSVRAISPNCWSRSWGSQVLLRPFTPRLLMNALKAWWLTCTMHGMWFLNGGHLILATSTVHCSFQVIELWEEALLVIIPSKRRSGSPKQSRTSFKCMASLASVCWPLTNYPQLAFRTRKEHAINLIEWELYF